MTTRFISLLFIISIALASCKPASYDYTKIAGFGQGTSYHITYENRTGKDYTAAIDSILDAFNKSLSIYDSTSIISRINRNEPDVTVDNWFVEVFKKSEEINRISNGAFDITVGPVVRAWGFSTAPVPKHDSLYIDSLLQFVGMDKVRLVGQKVEKDLSGVQLDVNALAQGYSVDVVCDFLKNEGIVNYLVEIGGEVRAKGVNASRNYWRIGIDKPVDGNNEAGSDLEAVIEINDRSVATSGNYRKFYVENGVKYSHTIDPKTGRPARNSLLSVTVVATDCMTADALATSFMVLGLEQGKELVKKLKGVEVLFIYSDEQGAYNTLTTEGMDKVIVEMAAK
jgi:thiamine biosynthesis lipoprotein